MAKTKKDALRRFHPFFLQIFVYSIVRNRKKRLNWELYSLEICHRICETFIKVARYLKLRFSIHRIDLYICIVWLFGNGFCGAVAERKKNKWVFVNSRASKSNWINLPNVWIPLASLSFRLAEFQSVCCCDDISENIVCSA